MVHRRRRGRPADACGGDAGESLIETLIAVALMATAVIGILGGLLSLIRISDEIDETTRSGNGSQAAAERVKQPVDVMAYVPCATPSTYESTLATVLPTGYTATITDVDHLGGITPGASAASPGSLTWIDASSSGCSAATDGGLQRITLTVAPTDDTSDTEVVRIIKRDARCTYSSAYTNLDEGPC